MISVKTNQGFTLIELLVVVTIIGILAAIALPQFKEYRARAYDSQSQSDLRNAAVAQEAYFLDHERYSAEVAALPGHVQSADVVMNISAADEQSWAGVAFHPRGTKTFCFDTSVALPLRGKTGIGQSCP
jgi:prepilin-type N-terminal cleavage/methylation domain-containing protein